MSAKIAAAPARSSRAGGAELIGESDALGDQVVAAADQGAQRRISSEGGRSGAEAMAVGAQQIGEDEGVAGIALAPAAR